jgi:hypothetical protein
MKIHENRKNSGMLVRGFFGGMQWCPSEIKIKGFTSIE